MRSGLSTPGFPSTRCRSFPSGITDAWVVRTGALGLGKFVENWMFRQIGDETFDVVFVDHGELVDPSCVRRFKTISNVVVNYNQDNPYVAQDMRKWRLFLKALPDYDLAVTPRGSSVAPAKKGRRAARP
ncbi:hypothetical protein [Methylocella sp.]|uniref:hypothetical protein n=1 Tax=Methylocella sp. TaxID=1978226 RepID=UPI0037848F85